MPTFIMLSTLTPEGVQTVKNNPARIREVNKEVEQLGATVKAQWATLGHFDFINIVEAPDEKGEAGDVRWNFEKFLVDGDGTVVARFEPLVDPLDQQLTARIESLLA